ncbi:axin-1-like [Puntigrus tetrazona]|uniref:axin-1-like n=1 Tax=Puntigrus tetrazona TaxID=1606681 RepID=UPI001C8970C2|nr:axin-1-like [Puntigrus tetrazona]
MYRCYLCEGVVSRRITPETRCSIQDSIQQRRLHSGLFKTAHTQVQAELQDSLFPLFLRSDVYLKRSHTVLPLSGYQATPSHGEEPEKEILPLHDEANQKRAGDQECRQHRTRERDTRHTHLPHTPVKMMPHTFAAELMRRLQELQMQTQRHTEEETDTSDTTGSSSCRSLKMPDSDRDTRSPAHTHRCVTVVYCYDGEPVPYRSCLQDVSVVTLSLFKTLLTRRGPFRFFFKRVSSESDCGVVYEEIGEDDAVLPTIRRKIIARVERMKQSIV